MNQRSIGWINSPVLMEAIVRYQKGLLSHSMKLWIEDVLEIKENQIGDMYKPH
tara:strand:+ start:363 stop:521 length:159 start_codon:yes stop_codon:yes gene_type:complete